MNTQYCLRNLGIALALALGQQPLTCIFAATTIDPVNHSAWGANIGWIDARGDTESGVVIGECVCSGYLYAANVGWIGLGDGSPANSIRYRNNSAGDYGVNHDGLGNLRGYAWGANVGWVAFENVGAPRVDLATGNLFGHIWSANIGWISLSNEVAFVQTYTLAPGLDSDGDGIADAWELTYTNSLGVFNATSDTDQDGSTDWEEYITGTNPLDPGNNLRITSFTRAGTHNTLWWTSQPNRLYRVERRLALDGAPWETYLSYDLLGWTSVGFDTTDSQDFYRVRAVQPLRP